MAKNVSASTTKSVTMYVNLRVTMFIFCMYPRYSSSKQQDLYPQNHLSKVSLVIQNKVKLGNVNTKQLCKQNNLCISQQISVNGYS